MGRSILDRKNPWSDQDVEAHWDRVSDSYIRENNKVRQAHDQRFIEMLKHLSPESNSTILNITSRDCEAAEYILSREPSVRVINAEISQGLMNEARRVRPYVEQVKVQTYSELPFEREQFSRIVCLETLEHVASPVDFLWELHRISSPEARMVLSCPPRTSEPAYRVFTFFFGGHGEGPHRFLSSREVKTLLKHTGWNVLHHYGTLLIPVGPVFIQKFGEWIIRKLQRTCISELGIRQFYVCEKI
ncbi:MAG: methyltransferase domain-containing protein [Bacteroidales bacterium]|nr:methyltransferase domain-containing protein [Bacteroidales bacterium]